MGAKFDWESLKNVALFRAQRKITKPPRDDIKGSSEMTKEKKLRETGYDTRGSRQGPGFTWLPENIMN